MKAAIYIITISLSLFASSASAQKLKKYENSTVSLQYPDTWKVDSTKMKITGNIRLFVKARSQTLPTEIIIESSAANGITMDSIIIADMIRIVQDKADNVPPVSESEQVKVGVDRLNGYKITTRMNKIYTTFTQLLYKDRIYKITCFTSADNSQDHERDFEGITKSIRFKQ